LRCNFYNSEGCESDGLERVTGSGGKDSIFQFQLERGCDGIKHCRKMKQMQRARLDSMKRKRDTTWRRADMSVGGEATPKRRKGGDNVSYADTIFTVPKNKENTRGRLI
jgi:hypothetical protein